jgi:uroporphyrinogen decarboxylase
LENFSKNIKIKKICLFYMRKVDKINNIISGKEINGLSASFWRHFYNFEQDANLLAKALISFQRRYRWDFLKINTRASYHIEGWGSFYDYTMGNKPIRIGYPIKKVSDWKKIMPLKLNEDVFIEHIQLAKAIVDEFKNEVPVLFTIFLPIEIAARICGNRILFRQYLRDYPEYVEKALDNILLTFNDFARELVKIGIDGFFLATKCAEKDYLSGEEFKRWHKYYDDRFIELIRGDNLITVLHICGKGIRLDEMAKYAVNILHWDSSDGSNPSLIEVHKKFKDKVVMGGLTNKEMRQLTVRESMAKIRSIDLKSRWILSAECVLEPPFNEELLLEICRVIF